MFHLQARRVAAIGTFICAAALGAPAAASAHGGGHGLGAHDFTFDLAPVPHDPAADNGSNVTGASEFTLRGRRLTVSIVANGLDALPHAMHIHGEDLDNDGAYGGRITALGAPLEAELPVACGEVTG